MRILMFSVKSYDMEYFDATNRNQHEIVYQPVALSETTAALAKGFEAVCCFVNDKLDAPVLDILKEQGVRLIALRCAGFNNVDLAHASRLGLTVCRVPEYSPYAVAEHAVALILDLNRNIHRAHNRIRDNNYSLDGLLGFDLHGKNIGVIGGGKIGKAFITIMKGFGCNILLYDPFIAEGEVEPQVASVPLDTLFAESDIISLHCPLTPDTHHLIDKDAIKKMKHGVMIVNTSRGALIHTKDVIPALKSGAIGYLGMDVYEEEAGIFFENLSNSFLQDDQLARLQTFPNVTITSHQGFFTEEALHKISEVTLNNITHFEQGKTDEVFVVKA